MKRGFALFLTVCMVLSMLPAVRLTAFAAQTAAAEEIAYGSANLEGIDPAIIQQMEFGNAIDHSDAAIDAAIAAGTCPMCGATGITWEKKTAGVTINADGSKEDIATRDGETLHIYYDTEFDCTGNLAQMVNMNKGVCQNNTICMALKSTADITCTKYRIQITGTNNTLNIMGTGKITADQSKSEWDQGDLGLFQNTSGIVNLYGGEFKHVHKGEDFKKAALRVDGASAVFNIYAGAKIGPETQDTTKVAMNVQYTNGGTVNMFGGEIRNGVSPAWGYSGNVTITTKDSKSKAGTFNMYGGKIYGGSFLDADAVTEGVTNNATIGGNVLVGGKSQAACYTNDGSADYTCYAGTFNMYGGTISGGKANNGGNGGGNINIYHSGASATILGGTIEKGFAKVGGNIQSCGGDITIGGTALISGGESVSHGGNIQVNHTSCALTISGGKFVGGTTTGASANGGSVYVDKCQSLSISNAIFDGGHSGCHGGNLYIGSNAADKVATISNAIFRNGLAEGQGGNVSTAVSLTMENCTVADGIGRKSGGNINVSAQKKVLTLKDCTVYGGWVTGAWNETAQNYKPIGANWGGNIRTWGSDVVIDGGLYHSGYHGPDKAAHQGNNIACLAVQEKSSVSQVNAPTLTIGGEAVIVGDINASAPSQNTPTDGAAQLFCEGTRIVLKDAPQIVPSYALADGTVVKASTGGLLLATNSVGSIQADISGLSAEAKICINGVALDRVISIADANAANVASCFSVYGNDKLVALANADNQLVIGEKPYQAPAKPEAALGGQNLSDEVWAEVQKADLIRYKASEFELDANSQAACPACGEVVEWVEATYPKMQSDENGVYHFYIDADTEINKQYNWAALNGKNMTMCLMLRNGETEKNIGGLLGIRNAADGCVVNVMGDGILTSDGSKNMDTQFGVISMQGKNNTINLYGGTFIYTGDGEGRVRDDAGAYQPSGTLTAAAVTVKGSSNTVNMYEGVAIGPETQDLTRVMYNVRIEPYAAKASNTFNMYGGVIRNGVTNDRNTSGNVTTVYNSKYTGTTPTFHMYGGSIENGSYMQGEGITSVTANGGNIYAAAGTQLNVYGGTISGGKVNGNGGNIVAIDSAVTSINLGGGTIQDGQAKNGGNIYATANVEINAFALIEGGHATATGGNIYVTGKNGHVTQSSGSEVRNGTCAGTGGGNVFVNAAAIYNMNGGKLYDGKNVNTGTNANGGNVLVQGLRKEIDAEAQLEEFTDAYFNMSGDAEIYGGITANRAGNVRVYIGTFTMTDNARVYGGNGEKGCDNMWLVDGNLVMSGNATVIASDNSGDSVNAIPYRRSNTITLADNASITGGAKSLTAINGSHANYKTPVYSTLQINNGWTGTAYWSVNGTSYTYGDDIDTNYAVCVTQTDGAFAAGGTFAGNLYYGTAGLPVKAHSTEEKAGQLYVASTGDEQIIELVILQAPAKCGYFVGDTLAVSGLKIGAVYNTGATVEVPEGYTVSELDSTTAGIKTITVTYKGLSTSFDVFVTESDFCYTLSGGKATITGYAPSVSGDVVLPAVVDGHPVIAIGDSAFRNCDTLTSVVIPAGITAIGKEAFYDCDGLTNVYYMADLAQWDKIQIGSGNEPLTNALRQHMHSYEPGEPVPPTCTENGYTLEICATCGQENRTNIVLAVGHTPGEIPAVAPTCTQTGLTAGAYCTVCKCILTVQKEVPATGHSYVGGVCTACGAVGYVAGDLDGKPGVNEGDAVYLLQHVLFPDMFPVLQPVDFDKNSCIDEQDAIYLLQHVLFPDAFPLK